MTCRPRRAELQQRAAGSRSAFREIHRSTVLGSVSDRHSRGLLSDHDQLAGRRRRSPKDFLDKLDSANPEVRWRGAEELAQYLQREESLAANPVFALELCERLQSATKELASQEKELAEFKKQQPDTASLERRTKAFQQTENYVLYLSSCVASSIIPVGAPLLGEMAANSGGADAQATAQRRRWAMWNLGKLGDNVSRFDTLKPEQQEAIITALTEQAANPSSSRAPLAEKAGITNAARKPTHFKHSAWKKISRRRPPIPMPSYAN